MCLLDHNFDTTPGLKNCTELYLAAAQACTDPCRANYTWQASNAFSLPGGERESCNETWQYCKLDPSGCLEGVGLPKGGCAEVPQAMRMYSLGELGTTIKHTHDMYILF